jgi:hypothetical protein
MADNSKVNLYINSKFKKKDETNGRMKIIIPAGLLNLQGSDYYTLSVNGFNMFNTFYQLSSKNNAFIIGHRDISGNIYDSELFYLTCLGNPNVYNIRDDLNVLLQNKVTVTYDKVYNKFIFVRTTAQSDNRNKMYINVINCGNFFGLDNDKDTEIKTTGTESIYPINVIAHTQLLFNIDGDIQLPQNNLDNSDTICRPNSVLFYKNIDQQSNKLLTYDNIDGNNSFEYRITATETINQFVISVTNQDFEFIDDLPDWQLCLQFTKTKEDQTESLLTQIKEYLRYIFLTIANYIHS